jgi:hypothetical protein
MGLQPAKLALNGVLCVLFAVELGFVTWSAALCGVLCGGTGDCGGGGACCEAPRVEQQTVSVAAVNKPHNVSAFF